MKVGDKFPVTIAGHEVAVAVVRAVENGQVELQFEGRRVVMATRTEIESQAPAAPTTNSHAILGVEQANPDINPEHINAENVTGPTVAAENLDVSDDLKLQGADNQVQNAPAVAAQDTQVVQEKPVAPVSTENNGSE